MMTLRAAIAFFRGPQRGVGSRLFERHTSTFVTAQTFVRAYYAALVFSAVSTLPSWLSWLESRDLNLLWPVMWVRYAGEPLAWKIILPFYLASAVLAAAFPYLRAARFLAWLGLFQCAAMRNSFGKINHNLHIIVLTAFVLIFLPNIEQAVKRGAARAQRHTYLTIVLGAQALGLLTYTMAGLGKVVFFFYQAAVGQTHALSPDALATHVAEVIVIKNLTTLIGAWFIDHSYLGLPLMVGMMYVQFFSLWAAFRPAIHRPWGVMLIGFHIGTCAMMGILSLEHVLCVGLFMFASPFASSRKWSIDDMIWSLPVIGELRQRAKRWAK